MQAEYSQRKNRIKLRVTTSTGLNLLCTANRSQKIKELLPHIIKLYEEVKSDQGLIEEFGQTVKPFIKFIRKEEFLIAPSELVGDIFDDNDEVFCEIGNDTNFTAVKKQPKQDKKQKPSKKQSVEKEQEPVPKTKKIKKKNPKTTEIKATQTPSKQEPKKVLNNQPKQAQSNHTEQQKQSSKKQAINAEEQVKQPVDNKAGQQSKSKKKKNKNKNKLTPEVTAQQNQPTSPAKPTQSKPSKPTPSQTSKTSVKKVQSSQEQKAHGASLLSSDELNKFKQMLKKSSVADAQ